MIALPIALIQLNSGPDAASNLPIVCNLVTQAAEHGAKFILLPENTDFLCRDSQMVLNQSASNKDHPFLTNLTALAKSLSVWILIGSLHVSGTDNKIFNRSFLINDQGKVVEQYDKIHLFDVTLKNGEQYLESNMVTPGHQAVMAETPWGQIGMTICYDVRFPHLYRSLAKAGCRIICVPAAFTHMTGQAHWHVLLRARAIENGCFILAPAQAGEHDHQRKTYGHSLVVSPWGDILAEGSEDQSEIIYADLNLNMADMARRMIPSLRHDRLFAAPGN